MTIPSSASQGEPWVVVVTASAEPTISVLSNVFTVTATGEPDGPTPYVVRPGDTLFGIARRFGTTVSAIVAANPEITDPDLIFVGQRLRIPTGATG